MLIHITVRHGRFTHEVFTSSKLENAAAFGVVVAALRAKGFAVEHNEWPTLGDISLRVTGLKSDKAITFACDVLRRAGIKAGFAFTSTQHH